MCDMVKAHNCNFGNVAETFPENVPEMFPENLTILQNIFIVSQSFMEQVSHGRQTITQQQQGNGNEKERPYSHMLVQ